MKFGLIPQQLLKKEVYHNDFQIVVAVKLANTFPILNMQSQYPTIKVYTIFVILPTQLHLHFQNGLRNFSMLLIAKFSHFNSPKKQLLKLPYQKHLSVGFVCNFFI